MVGPYEALAVRAVKLRDVNWLGPTPLADGDEVEIEVKLRSTRPVRPGFLRVTGGRVEVELAEDEHGVSPGQACVFYADDSAGAQVLGGGWIAAALPDAAAA